MTDSQRQAVYNWETSLSEVSHEMTRGLSLDECRQLIEKVWLEYRPEDLPPMVTHGRGKSAACGDRNRIRLPKFARTKGCALHEAAHSLLAHGTGHGPVFARLVLELYASYCDVPVSTGESLGVSQRPRQVRFSPATGVPKPRSQDNPAPLCVHYKVGFRSVLEAVRQLPDLIERHGGLLLSDAIDVAHRSKRRPEILAAELRDLLALGLKPNCGQKPSD